MFVTSSASLDHDNHPVLWSARIEPITALFCCHTPFCQPMQLKECKMWQIKYVFFSFFFFPPFNFVPVESVTFSLVLEYMQLTFQLLSIVTCFLFGTFDYPALPIFMIDRMYTSVMINKMYSHRISSIIRIFQMSNNLFTF